MGGRGGGGGRGRMRERESITFAFVIADSQHMSVAVELAIALTGRCGPRLNYCCHCSIHLGTHTHTRGEIEEVLGYILPERLISCPNGWKGLIH